MKFVLVAVAIMFVSIVGVLSITECRSKPCLLVTVYYSALDDKSRQFFKDQLMPAYTQLRDYVIVNPIPFGHARETKGEANKYIIECPNGEAECRENRAHVCVMDFVHDAEPDLETRHYSTLNILGCAMSMDNAIDAIPKCVTSLGFSEEINKNVTTCVDSPMGNELLHLYGIITREINKPQVPLPIIRLERDYSEENQKAAMTNFKKFLCDKMPPNERPQPCLK